MSNLYGSIFALRAVLRPGLLVPGIKVDTIAHLDFAALKKAGYTGAVFDRDNCLTIPHHDTVVPEIADAWARCKVAFGRENVLVVSNSAGTSDDPVGIQAESLTHNLGVPVLRHSCKKPACGEEIMQYFRRKQLEEASSGARLPTLGTSTPPIPHSHPPSLNEPFDLTFDSGPTTQSTATPTSPSANPLRLMRDPRLVVIGDRLLTDILLSNTLPSPPAHLPIWTTRLWKTPDLPLLRLLERTALRLVLWHRNQTFRDGVLERRARGETWLGREGWIAWSRRWGLRLVRREVVLPEPVPPRTNELARFVLPKMGMVVGPPTTRLGWAWYYSKIGAWYVAKGGWVALVWAWIRGRRAASKGWALGMRKFKEARAKRIEKQESQPVQMKSP